VKANPAGNGKNKVPAALHALRRAAKRAVALGRATGTPVYVLEQERIIDVAKRNRKSESASRKSHK
jgi:hypothetical protein